MGKVFTLKEWLTLAQAAERLTTSLEEAVTPSDLIQAAHDGALRLAWYLRDFPAKPVGHYCELAFDWVQISYMDFKAITQHIKEKGLTGLSFPNIKKCRVDQAPDEFAKKARQRHGMESLDYSCLTDKISWLLGPFYLMTDDITKSHYAGQLFGSESDLVSWDGTIVEDMEGGLWQLQSSSKSTEYDPARTLPGIAEMVVMRRDLEAFEQSLATTVPVELAPGRREHQIETILAIIASLQHDPLHIPDGGKAKIKAACLTRRKLFTADGFDHAWKAALAAGLVRMENHEKFTQRE